MPLKNKSGHIILEQSQKLSIMNFFSKMFGDSDNKDTNESSIMWNSLTEINQLDDIVSESATIPVFIFKHSTRCSISRMALKSFEREYSLAPTDAKLYFLDLIQYRDISNAISQKFNVVHQSPQLLMIKNGHCLYHVSHSDIDATDLLSKIRKV